MSEPEDSPEGQAPAAAPKRRRKPAGAASPSAIQDVAQVVERIDQRTATTAPALPPTAVPPPPSPEIAAVAARTEVYTVGREPVPPPELNPALEIGARSEPERAADLSGDNAKPYNLDDLMAQAPQIGNGQYYISVDRRAPPHWGGVQCRGMQKPIERYMTFRDFVREYGGGDYTLVLYGPPPRGATVDPRTRRPRVKQLSQPVKLSINPDYNPPNLNAALLDEEGQQITEEDEEEHPGMRYTTGYRPANGRPPTSADARMFEAHLGYEERMRDREERRERERQTEISQVPQQIAPLIRESLETVRESAAQRDQIYRSQVEQERQERERERERAEKERERAETERREREKVEREAQRAQTNNDPTKIAAVLVDALAKLQGSLHGSDDGKQAVTQAQSALEEARKTLQAMQDRHAAEVGRLEDRHRAEVQRLETAHREDLRRVEERAKDAEKRADTRIEEAEKRSDQRVRETREELQRAITEQDRHAQQRLDDERRQHERDLASAKTTADMRVETQKTSYETRIAALNDEVARLRAETERWRTEAENNKDLPAQIEKFNAVAAQMGYSPPGGEGEPGDWKSMLGRIGLNIVEKLPDLISSAGDTITRVRSQAVDPAAVQHAQYQQMVAAAGQSPVLAAPPLRGRSGTFQPTRPFAFGTEDGPDFEGESAPTALGPRMPGSIPERPGQVYSPVQPLPVPGAGPPPPPPAPPPSMMPQPVAAMQQPPMQPPFQAPPPQPPAAPAQPAPRPAPAPAAGAGQVPTALILQFAPVVEQALAQQASPDEVAQEFVAAVGPDKARQIATSLTVERVVVELQRSGGAASPLVRRQGQQFLREIWASVRAQTGG